MSEEDDQHAADRKAQVQRKYRDLAGVLPVLGVALLATPLIAAVSGGDGGALPQATLYIFAAWGFLILLAFILSRFLDGAE